MDGKQAPVAVSCLLDLWTVFVLLEPFGAFLVNYLTKNMVAVLVSEILGFYLDVILSVCSTQRPRSLLLAFPTIYVHINLLLQITHGVVFQVVLQIITNLC